LFFKVLEKRQYGPAVDVWALGVIAFILLCGYPPFTGENDDALFARIMEAKVEFDPEFW